MYAHTHIPGTYIYFYPRTLSPLPHDCLPTLGARCEISDLREIYGAGRRHSAGSSGRCSSGGGPESAPFSRRVHGALVPRSYLETRGVPSTGAGPSQNGTCLGGAMGSKIRAREKYRNSFSVREDQSLYTPLSLHRAKESFFLGENCSKQSFSWCYLLIARSCMNVCFGVD